MKWSKIKESCEAVVTTLLLGVGCMLVHDYMSIEAGVCQVSSAKLHPWSTDIVIPITIRLTILASCTAQRNLYSFPMKNVHHQYMSLHEWVVTGISNVVTASSVKNMCYWVRANEKLTHVLMVCIQLQSSRLVALQIAIVCYPLFTFAINVLPEMSRQH